MPHLGLDIGGANIKWATSDGRAGSIPFALWKEPAALRQHLQQILPIAAPFDAVGVTMTGELCDCFETKAAGVSHIVFAVESVFPGSRYWCVGRGFADAQTACRQPRLTAASNWHAQATWVGREYPRGEILLIDMGTTTTDLIRIRDGAVQTAGWTDEERLQTHELLYFGWARTGVATLLPEAGLCREYFASTKDCCCALELTSEDPNDCETADGRPATRDHALNRLARMLGGDRTTIPADDSLRLATRTLNTLLRRLEWWIFSLGESAERFVVTGSGTFLVAIALQDSPHDTADEPRPIDFWKDRLGMQLAETACAYAVARLLAEERL
jgi:(4-(4-[2-(gamma-L-glutamylamino)ethyl]phenoxymethyl)furan-2-yl)methanamine synthase